MFHKMTRLEHLKNYNAILEKVSSSIQTNTRTEAVIGVAISMLDTPGPWITDMIDVKGHGNPALRSYLIPDRDIYLMEADPQSVIEVLEKIKVVLDATAPATEGSTTANDSEGDQYSDGSNDGNAENGNQSN